MQGVHRYLHKILSQGPLADLDQDLDINTFQIISQDRLLIWFSVFGR
jgi:hypothetical protein